MRPVMGQAECDFSGDITTVIALLIKHSQRPAHDRRQPQDHRSGNIGREIEGEDRQAMGASGKQEQRAQAPGLAAERLAPNLRVDAG